MNEEKKKILKMVEDGVISSEEAAELFESLEQAEKVKTESNYLSEQVDWEKGEEYKSQHAKSSNATKKSKFVHFLEEAVTKIKNVDLDFNFGSYTDISHIFHMQNADFSKLELDISNGSVSVEVWEEVDVRVECEVRVYQVDNKDQARKRFLSESVFSVENDLCQLLVPSRQIKVKTNIKIPQKMYEKISIRLFNGPIGINSAQMGKLFVKTNNGTVQLEQLTGTHAQAESTNGSIKAEQVTFKTFDAETINGSIRTTGEFEKVETQVVTGSIHCNWDGEQATTGFFKTATGSIRLALPQDKRIDGMLTTNIGSIHCGLEDYYTFDEQKDMVKKVLHFEANREMESLLHIEAETKTGSIWVLPNKTY